MLLLPGMGERYSIKVAFHIELHGGRTAATLAFDVKYLYERYADHPAFFRTTAFVINGRLLSGALPFEAFEQAVESAIAEAAGQPAEN